MVIGRRPPHDPVSQALFFFVGHDLVVDGSKKGQPGDLVVVWPVKGGPVVARRLARCSPYNNFFFQTLAECRTLTVPCNKVRLIHAVIDA